MPIIHGKKASRTVLNFTQRQRKYSAVKFQARKRTYARTKTHTVVWSRVGHSGWRSTPLM